MERDTHTRRCEVIDVFGRSLYPPQHHLRDTIGFAFSAAKLLFEFFHRRIAKHSVQFSHSKQVCPELHASASHQISVNGFWGGCGTQVTQYSTNINVHQPHRGCLDRLVNKKVVHRYRTYLDPMVRRSRNTEELEISQPAMGPGMKSELVTYNFPRQQSP
ncbi:hypothetical protein SAMN04487857_108198 [Pseudomonas sp. ok272]|nr:hypothetical protein SAMN04487857_108198 [Pseudomonas sp. ok272]SFM87216.1 hypothetical protein SAMN04487858_10829 [Pseudomonas sp. ok602]